MGRLEPLTSLALGRSRYDDDDVVLGEGEVDPREPEKEYDRKGRVINPRTKDTIKGLIRAHNEVMQVIGVAEPDSTSISVDDLASAKQYHEYESDTGRGLYQLGTSLGILGTWGIINIRRRIMVYKRRADVSFFQLLRSERNSHSLLQLHLAGYPSHAAMHALRWTSRYLNRYTNNRNPWLRGGIEYVRFHLHLFLTMQRLDLIPASQLFPGIKFFIPFSSSSPFAAPPAPESLGVAGALGWLSQLVANMAPYATFYVCGCVWQTACSALRSFIRRRLPHPISSSPATSRVPPPPPSNPTERQTVPESPTLGAADREIRHQSPEAGAPTSLALDIQSSGETIPVGSIRRQSTFSNRAGEDYGTDEEDSEMINPTLISFDVDTSESTEPPTGVWSAELRPSFGGDSRQLPKEAPKYLVTPLTSLPSVLASDIIADFVINIISIPLDAYAFPTVARALARRRDIAHGDMFDESFLKSITWQGLLNIIQLDIIRLFISGEVWALATVLSQWLHVTEEEWRIIKEDGSEDSA
ncbi:hypothetical protein GGS23DRAFT_427440 [Durotheca rogersii]|uniref:uncharacterized protein n=1 Tax=Durotheca rogersii TaxID=419775 RepID=UPI002220D8EA|nr:uncharacterized protein GGS23DRAFT_427440 [Durotheca rogersii]KAI5865455.1 hypothetical protein GGS23DRAFT_427440 [Durotheca rogersii]